MPESELIEVTVGAHPTKRQEMFAWAIATFGEDVEPHDSLPLLYFHKLSDAEFFVLKWS